MTAPLPVLAATDFSPDALHACRRAGMLAAEHGVPLDLLHVVEPDIAIAVRELLAAHRDLRARIDEQADMQLAAVAQQLQQLLGIAVRPQLRHGPVPQEIVAASAQSGLLVVGARGTHALRQLALGTTADRLMRTIDQPLLVVRRPPAAPYARILVLMDFSEAAQAALRTAMAVAPRAAVHVMHAVDLPYEGKLRLAGVRDEEVASFRDHGLRDATSRLQASLPGADRERLHVSAVFGDVRFEALRMITELGADLVAVGKQGTSLAGDMFLGSTTSCMMANAPCDVLAIPATRAAAS